MVDVTRVPNITIAVQPPVGPALGDLWWSPISGQQNVWYDDGNTTQWVISNWGTGKPGPAGLPGSVFIDDYPPMNPAPGTLWWSNDLGVLFVYYDDGNTTQWVATGGGGGGGGSSVFVGDVPPAAPLVNSLWWNSTLGALFIYYNDGNSIQWVPASPSSASTTSFPPPGYVLAENYGTAKNEITLNAAMADARARGLNVMVGPGTWTTTDGGCFFNPGVEVVGAGPEVTKFKKTGLLSCFKAAGTTPPGSNANPRVVGPYTLAAGVAMDDVTIVPGVANAGTRAVQMIPGVTENFSVGQKVIILSSNLMITGFTRCAEFLTIQKIDHATDIIMFWGALKFSYTMGGGAELAPYQPLKGVAYRNLSIEMNDSTELLTSNVWFENFAIDCRFCEAPVVENVLIHDIIGAGIFFTGCSGAKVINCRIRDGGSNTTGGSSPSSTDGKGGFGYGVREEALNEGLIVSGLLAERLRHGYTNGGGYGEVFNYGGQFGTTISHSLHLDPKEAGWDTHIEAMGLKLVGCGVIGGRFTGFQTRSRGTIYESCFVHRCFGAALWIRGGGNSVIDPGPPIVYSQMWGDETVVRDFHALETNWGDISPITAAIHWMDTGAIVLDALDVTIDGATVTRCGGPALEFGLNGVSNRNIVKNLISRDPCQLTTVNKWAVNVDSTQTNSTLEIDGLTSYSSDGKVTHVVRRSAIAATVGVQLKLQNVSGYGHTGKILAPETNDDGITVFANANGPKYLARNGASLYDDFLGNALSTVWKGLVGSDPQCVAPAIVTTNPYGGKVRLISGDSNGGPLTDLCSLVSALNWRAEATLTAEFRVLLGSTALECVFIGFTDDVTTVEMPFSLQSGTDNLTSTCANGFGFLFDTFGLTQQWHLVGVTDNVDATRQFSGVVPTSSALQRLRVDVGPVGGQGQATFMINGAPVGTIMTSAVNVSTPLTPVVAIMSRTTAVKVIDVDHIYIEQNRST